MENELSKLLGFLDRFHAPVEGRAKKQIGENLKARMGLLAESKLSAEEREVLCEEIRDDPAALKWLADRLKEVSVNEIKPGKSDRG